MTEPIVTSARPQHSHGLSHHEHDWDPDPFATHCHGGTMHQPSMPTGEVIESGKPRDRGPAVHHDNPGAKERELR